MGKRLTLTEVITKFKNVHGDKYLYNKFAYHGNRVKSIIICKKHGEFLQHSNSHLNGNGCPICKKETSIKTFILKGSLTNKQNRGKTFIKECSIIHPNLDFSKTNYVDKNTNIIVTCKIHGDYSVKPKTLLNGHSCKKCFYENYTGSWTLENWEKICDNGVGYFYIILMFNKNEKFIKCGITNKSVNKRKNQLTNKYQKKIILEVKNRPKLCFELEKEISVLFKDDKISPIEDFCGKTECYKFSSLGKIKKYINDKTK